MTASPIGWSSGRFSHCYSTVIPIPGGGSHLSIHRGLSSRLQRRDTQANHIGYRACIEVLRKQRPHPRIFACQRVYGDKELQDVTDRLHTYDPKSAPAESRRPRGDRKHLSPMATNIKATKPIYSSSEVQAIVDRLSSAHGSHGDDDENEGKAEPIRIKRRRSFYTGYEVDEIISRIIRKNQRHQSGRYHRTSSAPGCEKKRTESDVDSVTDHVSNNDPQQCPPESKGKPPRDPPIHSQRPPSGKKQQDLMDRLAKPKVYKSD